jgi:hypothetical protein
MAEITFLSDRFGLRLHLSHLLAIRESRNGEIEFRVGALFRNGNGGSWSGCGFLFWSFLMGVGLDINGNRQMRMLAPPAPFRIGI